MKFSHGFSKNIMSKDGVRLPLAPQIATYMGKLWQIFLLLLLVGTTFSPMLQKFFALSRVGQYFYQDITYCNFFGLALSFAKTKGSILGRTKLKSIALQNFKTTYFLRATHIFAGKQGSKVINLGALMRQHIE